MYEYDTYKTKNCPFKTRKLRELPELKVTGPEVLANYMKKEFLLDEKTEEFMYLICTRANGTAEGIFLVSRGAVNCSLAIPSEIFKRVLAVNGVNFMLIHNHPSGDVKPSKEDIITTQKINSLSKTMGINFVDHVIVGDSYCSLKEENYL